MGMMGGGSIGGLASAGFTAAGDLKQAEGQKAAYDYQSQVEARAANVSKVQGIQTLGQMTNQLNQVLGNIDTVRAAGHDDPTSPTGSSIRDTAEYLGNMNKTTAFDYYYNEEDIHKQNSQFLLAAGQYAMQAGQLGAAGAIAGGIGGAL
jgi:hypothetical protein